MTHTDAKWTHWACLHRNDQLMSLDHSAELMGGNPTFTSYADAEAFVENPINIELFGRMSVIERDDQGNPDHLGLQGWELYCNDEPHCDFYGQT